MNIQMSYVCFDDVVWKHVGEIMDCNNQVPSQKIFLLIAHYQSLSLG